MFQWTYIQLHFAANYSDIYNEIKEVLKRHEELQRLEKERQVGIRSYKGLMVSEKMTSNKQIATTSKSLQELEEDFM
ncbi:hypothetical protein Goshw_002451 [Gossypium schwendimanii]|uniref:Uncharacterized protein n=1 Tax=Gossypium schwendimanii TaxID=34291 RepID=A0A7J9MLS6_GOSSC|nr:hypothetical protein [Gossypium schwendimanii]